jgi:NAD(P)-dependent dehydrogenase (short-subunit alcohol dehydrogenase family)
VKLDVTSWSDLCSLFDEVYRKYGRVDILYANAGIYSRETFLSVKRGSDGQLEEPSKLTIQVNLAALGNQVALAAHYMMAQETPKGGSIVLTASSTSYQRFDAPDYVASKHGVIGLLRGASVHLKNNHLPIRINAVAPSWTRTGLVPLSEAQFEELGIVSQAPEAVARSVALLATDESRSGQCIYSRGGEYVEMEAPMHAEMLKQFGYQEGSAEEDEREQVINVIFGAPKDSEAGTEV